MIRLRITFTKTGSLRYTGHLDMQTVWERTARRAGLPLAYTQGFHPGPRIQIASALPLGFIGHAEIVDLWLKEPENVGTDTGTGTVGVDLRVDPGMDQATTPGLDTETDTQVRPYKEVPPYAAMLQPAAPPGLTILTAEKVDEHGPALQTQVASAEYLVTFLDPVSVPDLEHNIRDLLASPSLPRERRGKPYDLRPLIESLSISPPPSGSRSIPDRVEGSGEAPGTGVRVFMRLSAREAATGRPEEVLAVLGIPFENTRIERLRIILKTEIE